MLMAIVPTPSGTKLRPPRQIVPGGRAYTEMPRLALASGPYRGLRNGILEWRAAMLALLVNAASRRRGKC